MTATLGNRRRADGAAPRPADGAARRRGGTTPATLRSLLTALILLSLAWGALGGWVASEHAAAAATMVSTGERLSPDAQRMYESVADADATVTAALLASSEPPLSSLRRYQADIAQAADSLSRLRAAGGDQAVTGALGALSGGLPSYAGEVADAESEYALGYPLTGGSFLQVASEQAHLVLLPAARTVFLQEHGALAAASRQATGLPLVIVALVLAIITGIVLYRAQRWLTRRTHRLFSAGLVLASVLLIGSALWLAAGFLAARSDLDHGIAHGSEPVQNLAQASIDVQQIRGDAVLNVISRSGSASFRDDFQATRQAIGPGPGTLLSAAAAAQAGGGRTASVVAAAERAATSWYAANAQVYRLGQAADYAGERDLVIGTGPSSSAAQYSALALDIAKAIRDDQAAFASAATRGSGALRPLAPAVIVAALLMALSCWWGLRRRLAEYR